MDEDELTVEEQLEIAEVILELEEYKDATNKE